MSRQANRKALIFIGEAMGMVEKQLKTLTSEELVELLATHARSLRSVGDELDKELTNTNAVCDELGRDLDRAELRARNAEASLHAARFINGELLQAVNSGPEPLTVDELMARTRKEPHGQG